MLDGFIIEGNVLELNSKKLDEVKINVFKKHYRTVLVSILVHIVSLILLLFVAEKQQAEQEKQIKIIPKAIKSYLYKMPVKPVKAQPEIVKVQPAIVKKEVKQELSKDEKTEKAVDIKQKKLIIQQEEIQKATTPNKTFKPAIIPDPLSTKTKSQNPQPAQATFSAYKQLNNLRNSINAKMMAQEVSNLQKFRSPSVMHGEQIPVPHSNKQLTAEQVRVQNTTKMSNNISITKYDNGHCIIEREQFLGSPVEASRSAFACGESKFDKSFRAHMKKVQAKLLPVK